MRYSELKVQILFEDTLEQCYITAYVFHFVEFENLKYVYMLIYDFAD